MLYARQLLTNTMGFRWSRKKDLWSVLLERRYYDSMSFLFPYTKHFPIQNTVYIFIYKKTAVTGKVVPLGLLRLASKLPHLLSAVETSLLLPLACGPRNP